MNNIYISAEEISELSESLAEEISRVKSLFGEIYDIKENYCREAEIFDDEISADRKEMEEICDVFCRFAGFAGKVSTEYSKCEKVLSEMVDAIRV